jgi:integrase/recombinase XerD
MNRLPPDGEEFLVALRSERGLAANTVAAYRRDLSQYLSYVGVSAAAPDPEAVSGFVKSLHERGLAASTIARKIAAIRGYHRFLVAEGLADQDPTLLVDTPRRGELLPKALTFEEIERLLDAVDPESLLGIRDRALLEFLYGTGCRVSEAVDVEVLDVDLDSGTALLTGKGDRQRIVPVGRYAREAIERYLPVRMELRRGKPDPGRLFLNSRGEPLSRQGVWLIVRRSGHRAGIPEGKLSPHVLRHSAATHMVEGGADLRTVQEMLGHASISTTQVYTRVSPRHLYEVFITAHPRAG